MAYKIHLNYEEIGGVTVNLIGNTDLGVSVDLSTTTDNAESTFLTT
ncbi:MAG: hypothetical protein U0T36_08265 [Saprospiraceae bacterium]